jgi:putative transposase
MKDKNNKLTTRELAKKLGVSRSSLYYEPKRPAIDEEVKNQIESVMVEHKSYGHKRIARELKLNKKRILRVMKKYGLKPMRRRVKKPKKPKDNGKPGDKRINISKLLCPMAPSIVWVSDFTYIRYGAKFIYLSTIMDQYTREIVGNHVARFHNAQLTIGALTHALENTYYAPPQYLHSDRGSEYEAEDYSAILNQCSITQSFADKQSPWQNAYQESFYSQFKVELADTNRFETLGELIEAIHHQIVYYNSRRIHTSLKMSPHQFRKEAQTKLRLLV